MYRTLTPVALGLAAVLATGCSGEGEPELEWVEAEEPAEAAEGGEVAEPLEWGETATVAGENGTPMELTPVGVRYVDADEIDEEFDRPDSGVFVAVEVEAAAVESPETPAGGAGPGGFAWRLDGQQTSTMDGNVHVAPWVGAVPEFTMDTVLLPDEDPASGVEEFDVSGVGGQLSYTDLDGTLVRWEAPEESEGEVTGVDEVL